MADSREQIIAHAVHAVLNRPYQDPDAPIVEFARADVEVMLPIAVRAVTDRVRARASIQAMSCHAAPGEYVPERPWLDLLALLDQVDAEMGAKL